MIFSFHVGLIEFYEKIIVEFFCCHLIHNYKLGQRTDIVIKKGDVALVAQNDIHRRAEACFTMRQILCHLSFL
jgi:hypothetical protein